MKLEIKVVKPLGKFWNDNLREKRKGIMLHYDASTSDAGAVAWLKHKDCKAGYNYLVLDDGTVLSLAPRDARAWHAGKCDPSPSFMRREMYGDANSAFYGVAVAATKGDRATYVQGKAVEDLVVLLMEQHGWGRQDVWRITTHAAEAWPRGRKTDPGPVLPVALVADGVRLALR